MPKLVLFIMLRYALDITEFKMHELLVQKSMKKAPSNVCKTNFDNE